ncbi:hypothetical protein H839_06209 [Parageobacillus genomosp. 1]|uniref:Tetratricopeptide repeat protein n=1 Tax=Parageobacillus genomosp. 1 TaxID=1295642 RepID=A0ABC9VFE4_9BACL|nr:tetratricopeptide repeat protein [Parageobacillus genomosp. 1]EZP77213.1 hypothetical protein H839_06209 [Parageobacillus genomosp. 1]
MNNFHQLVNQLQERVRQEPNNVCLINDLAIALMEINHYEEAFFQFKKAADIYPNVQSLNNLAYFYYHEGEPLEEGVWRIKEKEAIELLKKVIEHNPSSYFPYNLLGEIYTANHHYNQAKEVLLKAICIQPTLENLNNLGICYYKTSFLEKAAEYFYKANLERKENNFSLYPLLSYGICLAELGEREEALKNANELLILNQELEDNFEDQIAHIYYITGDYSEFVNIYSKLDLLFYEVDWIPPYLFALKELGRLDKMEDIVESIIKHKLKEIQETLVDDEEEWEPGRKEEYMNELQTEIKFLRNSAKQIMEGKQPTLEYEPIVETRCYLFGCKRHNNPNYLPC